MFKNPFSFSGRIRRTEFGLSIILYYIVYFLFLLLSEELGEFGGVFIILVYFGLMWFMIAQSAKRCHDRGNSGWYQLIPFYVIWLIFANSDFGPNEYGDNPKGEGNYEDINEIGKIQNL